MSYEQLARDYSETKSRIETTPTSITKKPATTHPAGSRSITNPSGARAGMLEAWKFFSSRRQFIGQHFARQVYALWLEEVMDRGDVPVPEDAPDFLDAKTAWCGCRWIGPGKGHIDPLKESKADIMEMQAGLKTLEDACAERGFDWEENLEQIAREKEKMRELGLR